MLCRVLRLQHVAIINRINPLLCLLIHFPYEFKPSCFLGHLNHKIPSGFSKEDSHSIWNFSVFTHTVWTSGGARTLSLFIYLSSLSFYWLFHEPCFPSSFSILTHAHYIWSQEPPPVHFTLTLCTRASQKEREMRNWKEIECLLTPSFSNGVCLVTWN